MERPDERRARDAVARGTGLDFIFTDLNGSVDYTTSSDSAALEVTRFTDPLVRRDLDVASKCDHVIPLGTSFDWWVTFDGHPKYDGLASRLYAPLVALETHGLRDYDHAAMNWWMDATPTLRNSARQFRREGVGHAQALHRGANPTELFVSSSGGWTYGGPDAALEMLESKVSSDDGHLRKLKATGAPSRHLWIWTDSATQGGLRSAFEVGEQRLPTRAPTFPEALTDLWCVDEFFCRGWRWSRSTGWTWVSVPEAISSGIAPP
jgi:hypothetical protein